MLCSISVLTSSKQMEKNRLIHGNSGWRSVCTLHGITGISDTIFFQLKCKIIVQLFFLLHTCWVYSEHLPSFFFLNYLCFWATDWRLKIVSEHRYFDFEDSRYCWKLQHNLWIFEFRLNYVLPSSRLYLFYY